MVLEEVSSDPDPYFSSASDDEPSTSTLKTPQVDLSRIPHPIPFSTAWGFSVEKLQEALTAAHTNSQTVLKRSLTPGEVDALSYHYAKGYRYASYGPPIGVAVGLWRAITTANEFRWPAIPRAMSNWSSLDFNKESQSLSFRGKELARGPWLRPTILGLKGIAYVNLGYFFAVVLFNSYGATVSAVGALQDPRLRELKEKGTDQINKNGGELRIPKPPRTGANGGRVGPTGQGDQSAAELWKKHRGAIARNGDEASPTAGNDDSFSDVTEDWGNNESMMTDSQLEAQQRSQQPSSRRSPTDSRAPTLKSEKPARQPQSFSDDFDMTRPSTDDQSPTSTASSGESAWGRIRRENASSGSSTPRLRRPQRQNRVQQEQQEGSTAGDSFTFSSSDSERSYAKDEAQKHFDERVEQERRGEDFGSGRRKW